MFKGIRNSTEHLLLHNRVNIGRQRAGCLAALLEHLAAFSASVAPLLEVAGLKTTLLPSRCALLDLMLVPITIDPFPPQGGNHMNDSRGQVEPKL